jgi:hypothetical protein
MLIYKISNQKTRASVRAISSIILGISLLVCTAEVFYYSQRGTLKRLGIVYQCCCGVFSWLHHTLFHMNNFHSVFLANLRCTCKNYRGTKGPPAHTPPPPLTFLGSRRSNGDRGFLEQRFNRIYRTR